MNFCITPLAEIFKTEDVPNSLLVFLDSSRMSLRIFSLLSSADPNFLAAPAP